MSRLTSILLVVFALMLLVSCGTQDSNSAEEVFVGGLKVIVMPNTANEIVAVQLFLKGGSRNLNDSTQGIESLLFNSALKGSKNYPKEELNEILDRTATLITTSSNRDYTTISMSCLNRYFNEAWKMFADIIMNPTLEEEDVELVREQLLSGIRQRKDDPDSYLNDIADELFYRDHVYGFDPAGVEESVADISIEQMEHHINANLQTSQLLLVVVGNVDKTDLKKKVANTFGKLPEGNYASVVPEMISHAKPDLEIVERNIPTNYIQGLFSAPGLNDPDYYPMVMAMNILSWRVWEEVRTKRNLSYAPAAFLSNDFANNAGIYVSTIAPDTTIKVMLAELEKLQVEAVSEKDLKDRITMYITRYYFNAETNADQARGLARYELSGRGWSAGEEFIDNLRTVTADDVQRVAQKYFNNIQFAVLGNSELIDRKLLTSI